MNVNGKRRHWVITTLLSLIETSRDAGTQSPYSGLKSEESEDPLTDVDADFEQIVAGLPTRLRTFALEYYYFGVKYGLCMPDDRKDEIYRVMDLVEQYRGRTRRTQMLLGA